MRCLTSWWQWAVELLSSTATRPRGIGQGNPSNALRGSLWAVGSATLALLCHTACGGLALESVQFAGPPTGGRGVLLKMRSLPKWL